MSERRILRLLVTLVALLSAAATSLAVWRPEVLGPGGGIFPLVLVACIAGHWALRSR